MHISGGGTAAAMQVAKGVEENSTVAQPLEFMAAAAPAPTIPISNPTEGIVSCVKYRDLAE